MHPVEAIGYAAAYVAYPLNLPLICHSANAQLKWISLNYVKWQFYTK